MNNVFDMFVNVILIINEEYKYFGFGRCQSLKNIYNKTYFLLFYLF